MKATVELQLIPLGEGVSVRQRISQVVTMLQDAGFKLQLHASGTNIEGDLHQILDCIEQIHTHLHQDGCVRLLSYVKIETRSDKEPTLEGKKL